MRNPFTDFLNFLQGSTVWGRLPIYLFVMLILASVAICAYNYWRDPQQRTPRNVYTWLARLSIGGMWFQQTLWKLPPQFTDNLSDPMNSGLRYWMGVMTNAASFSFHRAMVSDVVLPHFSLFAYQVWAAETFIAVSLMLGLLTRLGGWLGALMAFNLWLGLYNAPHEWPWTYFFLIVLMGFFAAVRAGRALGLDAVLAPRAKGERGLVGRALSLLT
jgi:uncharacterized membrane protein YphA (DoxX/SURF4 family)